MCLLIKMYVSLCGQVVQSHLRRSLVPGAHHSWGPDVIRLLTCSSSWLPKLSFPLCLHSCLLIVPAEYVFCPCFVCMLLGIESRAHTLVRWVPYHQYPSSMLSFSFYVWDKVSLKFSRMALNLWSPGLTLLRSWDSEHVLQHQLYLIFWWHHSFSRKGRELLQPWPHVAAPRHLLVDGLKRGRATAVVETPEHPDSNLWTGLRYLCSLDKRFVSYMPSILVVIL